MYATTRQIALKTTPYSTFAPDQFSQQQQQQQQQQKKERGLGLWQSYFFSSAAKLRSSPLPTTAGEERADVILFLLVFVSVDRALYILYLRSRSCRHVPS